MNQGLIQSVRDLIVTVAFDDVLPDIHEIIMVDETNTPLLVDSLQPGNLALCLNIQSDLSIQKGMHAKRTQKKYRNTSRRRHDWSCCRCAWPAT